MAILVGACLLVCCSDDTEILPPEVTSINPTAGCKTTVVTIRRLLLANIIKSEEKVALSGEVDCKAIGQIFH